MKYKYSFSLTLAPFQIKTGIAAGKYFSRGGQFVHFKLKFPLGYYIIYPELSVLKFAGLNKTTLERNLGAFSFLYWMAKATLVE